MGHLLGGMLMFALLVWMAWRATHMPITLAEAPKLKWVLRIGVAVHVAGDGHSAEQVIGMAAQAAHAARAEGNVVVWFDAAVTTRLADR
ncbi:hypothetical protein, partial [Enterobacter hormaechei]|uniref:hypothetical protein n=1 Tax=Enterobacter hormaechei TaxID=158836 RepID=UPI0020421EEB